MWRHATDSPCKHGGGGGRKRRWIRERAEGEEVGGLSPCGGVCYKAETQSSMAYWDVRRPRTSMMTSRSRFSSCAAKMASSHSLAWGQASYHVSSPSAHCRIRSSDRASASVPSVKRVATYIVEKMAASEDQG